MQTTPRPLRIAVVGAGLIGRRHVELISASDHCDLSALVDLTPASEALASDLRVPHFHTLHDLLREARPDGVVLATPNPLHVDQALACIEAGVPPLVEKPVAETVASGARLVDVVERRGVPVLVGHHRRHSPLIARARDIIASGRLGPIVAVNGTAMFCKPDHYFDEGPWRRQAGGGPILINLIHEIDDLRTLCGEIVSVQALASNATRGFEVEDTVAIGLRFASGALGTFMLSDTAACAKSWEQTSGENKSYPSYPDEDCYLVAGTQGSLSVPTLRLKTYAGERSWWRPFVEEQVSVLRDDPLERQLAHFCAVIRGEAQPLCTARDALQTLRVTLAVALAAVSGAPVDTSATCHEAAGSPA
jgi:predicted dehydrogenase